MKTININISIKSVVLFFALGILVLFIAQVKDTLLLLFASYVIASSLLPAINYLSKKMPKNLAASIVYLALIMLIITLIIPLVNILTKEGNEFIKQLPNYLFIVKQTFSQWNINFEEAGFIPSIENITTLVTNHGQEIINQTIHITHNILVAIIMITSLAMLILFMLLEKDDMKRDFLRFFPKQSQEQASLIMTKITRGVGIYVASKVLLMFLVCLMSTAGLSILNVKFAIFLGLVAGILEIIPIFGPIIASIPAIIVALAQDPQQAIGVIILYIIIFKVVNNVLAPIILGKCLNISPIVILAALLMGSSVLGVAGVILSPAIVVIIYVLVEEFYLNKINPINEECIQTNS